MASPDDFDEEEDEELAKAKEESLRYYEKVEVPRFQNILTEGESTHEILNTQIGGKDVCLLYNGSEAEGFHLAAGTSYVYPTNYPLRQYQATMVKTSLFKNTLVSLPTGLGKTFIAAVVMYNFYRWYPCGKVIFMAPTRPLVAQQVKACHDIMNIPVADTVEMTGNLNAQQRATLWNEKRVFFLTPQVMVNDLRTNACPASLIKCLVVDEAHRAVKDYAYCQVVRQLLEAGVIFRILALSATPGNDSSAVVQVIKNLNISALELRGEDALDVAPYTHSRSVESVIVDLSVNIQRVKQDFLQVYEKYSRKLKDYKALTSNISTISKFQILKACEKFRANPPRNLPTSLIGSLICDFTVCMSLAHALDLLQTYGLRAFYNYLTDESFDKNKAATTRIRNDEDLKKILDKLGQILQFQPGSGSYIWGHPKFQKLVSVVSDHFTKHETTGESTRAIIFCEYRVVVHEIVDILGTLQPLVRPVIFIGQSGGKEKGMPQAKQLQIMKNFRSGESNCLVSTCVGEEGLDVGDVDLIILVETHKSLTRLIQRIGRTGRKRKGRCVVLITRGKEEYKFQEAMSSRKSYVTNILNSTAIKSSLCQNNPRMLPPDINPERELVHIKPDSIITPVKAAGKKQIDIRTCLVTEESPFITCEQYTEIVNGLGPTQLSFNTLPTSSDYLWHRYQSETMSVEELLKKDSLFSEWIDWNRDEQQSYYLAHSDKTKMLCSLLNKGCEKSKIQIEGVSEAAIQYIDSLENEVDEDCKKKKHSLDGESSGRDDDLVGGSNLKGRRKKLKKEATKRNNCMDIRHCLANAADKGKPIRNPENIKFVDIEGHDVDVLSSFEETLNYFNSLYNVDIEKYLNLSVKSKCIYNVDSIELCDLLEKYAIPNSSQNSYFFEMPRLPDIETLIAELNDESMSKIRLNSFFDLCENSKFADLKENYMFTMQHHVFPRVVNKECTDTFSDSSNDLVGIDDLFIETEGVKGSCDEMDRFYNSPGCYVDWEEDTVKTVSDRDNGETNLNKICGIQGEFQHDMTSEIKRIEPGDNDKINYRKGMVSVTTPVKSDFTPLTSTTLNRFWESTPEGLENVSLITNPNQNKQSYLISSTPMHKLSNCPGEISVETHEDLSQDEWNLSDLLSDESSDKSSTHSREIVNETTGTMVNITQMLSMIENNKTKNNLTQHNDELKCNDINPTANVSSDTNLESLNEENDIKLLDIDDDIFVGIDELMSSNGSNKSVEHSLPAISPADCKLNSPVTQVAAEKNASGKNENDVSSEYSQSASQVQNFKKFNCSKKRLFDKLEDSTFKLSTTSCKTLNTKKIGLSLKARPLVKEIKTIKHIESSYFDFELNDSQMTNEETNSGRISESVHTSQDNKIAESVCIPNNAISFKNLHYFSQKMCKQKSIEVFDEPEEDVLFQEPIVIGTKNKAATKNQKKNMKKNEKENYGFLEKEADVSGLISSDDEDGSDLDDMDESFIDDRTVTVDICSKYLQSVKSPANGKFKLPVNKKYPPMYEVLSQTVNQDTEYLQDSFCVDSDEEIFEAEPSLLEIVEKKLARKERGKGRIKVNIKDNSSQNISADSSPLVSSNDSNSESEHLNNLPSKRKPFSTSSEIEKSSPQILKSKLLKKKFKRVKLISSSSDEGKDNIDYDSSRHKKQTKLKTKELNSCKSLDPFLRKQEELSKLYSSRIKDLSCEFESD